MIKAEYQAWKDGVLIHQYIEFDREKALTAGEINAVERYDYVLARFKKLSEEEQKKGIIYGGLEYDFSLEEVE